MRISAFPLLSAMLLASGGTAVAQPSTPSPAPAVTPMVQTTGTFIPGILVPGGTITEVSLVEPLSSSVAKEGDQIAIRVVKEVDIDGWCVIPAGAQGHATVTNVDTAGSNGHGGKLGLVMDWVYSQDGGKIKLSSTNHASDNGQQKGAASTATILGYVFLGPLGLFAHNFVRGRDATIETNQIFSVFVDSDVHVVTTTKAANPTDGFDK